MASDVLHFRSLASFEHYLDEHPKRGRRGAFPGSKLDEPHDISNSKYLELAMLLLSFDFYDRFNLFMHADTNEVMLADINTAGHGARSRIVRVRRADVIAYPGTMIEWYKNWAEKMWR